MYVIENIIKRQKGGIHFRAVINGYRCVFYRTVTEINHNL